jgi:hypothetical protein
VLKTAAVVLAFLSLMLFSTLSEAQQRSGDQGGGGGLLPSGNVYLGAAYGDNVDVVNRLTFRGWNASFEDFALRRFSYLSFVADGSGFYRQGVQQYNLLIGPRVSCIMESGDRSYICWAEFNEARRGGRHVIRLRRISAPAWTASFSCCFLRNFPGGCNSTTAAPTS